MKLKEFKEWVNSLPEQFDEFDMVNGEIGQIEGEDGYVYRIDKPILSMTVDETTSEVVILHQTMDEIKDIKGD